MTPCFLHAIGMIDGKHSIVSVEPNQSQVFAYPSKMTRGLILNEKVTNPVKRTSGIAFVG